MALTSMNLFPLLLKPSVPAVTTTSWGKAFQKLIRFWVKGVLIFVWPESAAEQFHWAWINCVWLKSLCCKCSQTLKAFHLGVIDLFLCRKVAFWMGPYSCLFYLKISALQTFGNGWGYFFLAGWQLNIQIVIYLENYASFSSFCVTQTTSHTWFL